MEPSTQFPSEIPPHKNWFSTHHILGYLFVFFSVAALASAIYNWEMTKRAAIVLEPVIHRDSNANWKIYTNTEYGFEFKYPRESKLDNDEENKTVRVFSSYSEGSSEGFVGFGVSVKKNSDQSLEQACEYNEAKSDPLIKNLRLDVFRGINAVYLEDIAYAQTQEYCLIHNQSRVRIYWDKGFDINNQILSTFKFTDSGEVKTFNSSKLGISFQYFTGEGGTNEVKEVGNKVLVGGENGQFVEMFSKSPEDTLAVAIQKKFLTGISETDCFIKVLPNTSSFAGGPVPPSNHEKATIAYPFDPDNFMETQHKCPPQYSMTNGISYFLMDQNHPSKFFFFSIGQYAISAEAGSQPGLKSWQDTFKVIN